MKKIILFIVISVCFSSTTWEKGLGLSATSNERREGLLPGIGMNINFIPGGFFRFNDNFLGLKLDIFISGMIYYEAGIDSLMLFERMRDLEIHQFQTIDLIYRRNLKNGKIDISLFPLQSSKSEFNIFTRIAYKVPLRNNFVEFFLRRIGSSKYPQIGIIYQW